MIYREMNHKARFNRRNVHIHAQNFGTRDANVPFYFGFDQMPMLANRLNCLRITFRHSSAFRRIWVHLLASKIAVL
jgi:hypothetical protein